MGNTGHIAQAGGGGIVRRGRWLGVLLLLLAPLLWRFLDLEADPPLNVAFIPAFATDEGFYSYHARHVVLFGEQPPRAYWDNQHVSPLFDGMVQAAFRLFPPGLWALRLPQVLLGIATVVLLYVLLHRAAGPATARWGALFLAWNHLFFVFNRVGFYHTLLALLCLACAYGWLRAEGRARLPGLLLSGAMAGLALLTSFFSLLFLAGLALAGLLLALDRRRLALGGVFPWLGGLALVLAPALLWAMPRWPLIQRDLVRSGATLPLYSNPIQTVANLFLFLYSPVFLLNLVPLFGVCLYTGAALRHWRDGRRLGRLPALLLGWFWSGAAVLALINYRPPRYFLYLLVPACAALALVVTRWENYARLPQMTFLWPAVPLFIMAGLVLRDRLGAQRFQGGWLWWLGVALSWVVALLSSFRRDRSGHRTAPIRWGLILAIGCLVANGAFSLSCWLHREHTVVEASRQLAQRLPEEALLLQGCTLSLETPFRCLPIVRPEEINPEAFPDRRLFYWTEWPDPGLPGDRLWGRWSVLDGEIGLHEVAPGRRHLDGVDMIQF